MRIVSLVPAATQAVAALGMGSSLVGITHECGRVVNLSGSAAKVLTRSRVPTEGTSSVIDGAVRTAAANKSEIQVLDAEALAQLQPDIVIVPADLPEGRSPCTLSFYDIRRVTSLMQPAPRLVAWAAGSLQEALGSLRALGEVLGRGQEAARLVADVRTRGEAVQDLVRHSQRRPRVALLSWIHPPVSAGGLLAQCVEVAGGQAVLGDSRSRSRTLDWPQVVSMKPEVVVLAPCGLSLRRVLHEAETLRRVPGLADTPAARWGQVHAVDGLSFFSAPGISSLRALEILAALIHPELPWP